jgi:hypothetical protein
MNEDEEGVTSSLEEVDLKYSIYTDPSTNTVYLKFTGYEDEEQMNNFVEYMDSMLQLILFQSETKH